MKAVADAESALHPLAELLNTAVIPVLNTAGGPGLKLADVVPGNGT